MSNTIIRKLAYEKFYFINIDGAIRQLKYIGNKVYHSNCCCEIYSYFVFVDGCGKEYLIKDNCSSIYEKLDNAIKCDGRTNDIIAVDVNDLIRSKGGCIGMTSVQFVAWCWDEKENKSERYSVGGSGNDKITYIFITNDGVKYLTKDNREIIPKSYYYFLTKEQCDAANLSNVKIVMFN